jgi:hypothetical protein
VALRVLIGVVVVFGLIQLIPYRVTNPPVVHEPPWDSPETRRLAVVACFDCHSNQTRGTWYEKVAPISWWIKRHVDKGRAALNMSDWTPHQGEGDALHAVLASTMPPGYYTWFGLHSKAKLTAAQRKTLAAGLQATFSSG